MGEILPYNTWPVEEKNAYEKNKYSLIKIKKKELSNLEKDILQNPEKIKDIEFKKLLNSVEIWKDWKIRIFGKTQDFWKKYLGDVFFYKLNTNEKISNDRFSKINLFWNIVEIWAEQAWRINNSMLFKSFRSGYDKHMSKYIDNVLVKYSELEFNKFSLTNEDFNKKINNIFSEMMIVEEKAESIFWEDDLKEINNIFFDKKATDKEKLIKILNLMRYEGWSWNSEWVKTVVENQLLKKEENKDIVSLLNNKKILNCLSNKDGIWLWNIIYDYFPKDYKEITTRITKAYKKIKTQIISRENSKEELLNVNKIRKENWLEKITLKNLQKIQIESWILKILQSELLYVKTSNKEKRYENNNSLESTYADLTWLWQTEWILWMNDWINIADDNIDIAIEFWVNLWIWIATLWAWTWALMGWRFVVSTLVRTWRIAQFWTKWKFIWAAVLDWITFYQWSNIASNVIFSDKINDFWDLFDWWNNLEANVDSILFMWMLNGIFKTAEVIKWTKVLKSIKDKIWKEFLEKKFIENTFKASGLGITTWVIMGISWTIEKLKWEDWHPSFKEYVELLVLLATFHKITTLKR